MPEYPYVLAVYPEGTVPDPADTLLVSDPATAWRLLATERYTLLHSVGRRADRAVARLQQRRRPGSVTLPHPTDEGVTLVYTVTTY